MLILIALLCVVVDYLFQKYCGTAQRNLFYKLIEVLGMCVFCLRIRDGDRLVYQKRYDEALLAYEQALRRIPEDANSSQRLAMLNLVYNFKPISYEPRRFLKFAAIQSHARYSVFRAVENLNGRNLEADDLRSLSDLLRLLSITGDPHLFEQITAARPNDDTQRLLPDLYQRAMKKFEWVKASYSKLIENYCGILTKPERYTESWSDCADIDSRLLGSCNSDCPLYLRCLYAFCETVIYPVNQSSKFNDRNEFSKHSREFRDALGRSVRSVIDKFQIMSRSGSIVGWSSTVTGELNGPDGIALGTDQVDPYVTLCILQYMLRCENRCQLRNEDIVSILDTLDRMQARNGAQGTYEKCRETEGNIQFSRNLYGTWNTPLRNRHCRCRRHDIAMGEILLDLREETPGFQGILDQMIGRVIKFVNSALSEETPCHDGGQDHHSILDYALFHDYRCIAKISDVSATASAIGFLARCEDVSAESLADVVEWLIRQQDLTTGAWPVVTPFVFSNLSKDQRSEEFFCERNSSLGNTVLSMQALTAWIAFSERLLRKEIELKLP
jgi:hypothetical protein